MRVLIAGIDGYLGWPLAQYLSVHGHEIGGFDALLRREWVAEVGGQSALPVFPCSQRIQAFEEHFGYSLFFRQINILDYADLCEVLQSFRPDAVVHLAEMPSAPYSMLDERHAAFTQENNVIGSLKLLWALKEVCPQAHLVKLGTMGEYGTPDIDIPEGFFEIEFRGRRDVMPFPRQAGSFYHWSKVHDSNNTMFACRVWGLRATDVMQGIVFGTRYEGMSDDPRLKTRFDFDQCFGTVINRFCAQAIIGHPLTLYGSGNQRRGFLPLGDVMACLRLLIENPPARGNYRVANQFDRCYTVQQVAALVQQAGNNVGLEVELHNIENPRIEKESHYYNPDREILLSLGYQPSADIIGDIENILRDLSGFGQRIYEKRSLLIPDIRWDTEHRRSEILMHAGDQPT